MKVKFNNETILNGVSAVEQKIYREGVGVGWTLMLILTDEMTADQLDSMLTEENISKIVLMADDSNSDTTNEATEGSEYALEGYDKVVSSSIRYFDGTSKPRTEIRLTKGV